MMQGVVRVELIGRVVVVLLYPALSTGIERLVRQSMLRQEAKIRVLALADFILLSAALGYLIGISVMLFVIIGANVVWKIVSGKYLEKPCRSNSQTNPQDS